MSNLLKIIILFCLTFSAWGQDQQFRLRGSFPFTDNQLPTASIVNFDIRWNEIDGIIRGEYQDNYFQLSAATVTGQTNANGRSLNLSLPETVDGVGGITIATQQTGLQSGEIATRINLRDPIGNSLASKDITATMVTQNNEITPATPNVCTIGFGVLSGYCGIYTGSINQTLDTLNRCDLEAPGGSLALEIGLNTSVNLYPRYVNTTVGLPAHDLGALPTSPLESTLTISKRICGELTSTRMNDGTCKTLTLTGTFSTIADERIFTGNYTIVDEVTNETCRYDLSLERNSAY